MIPLMSLISTVAWASNRRDSSSMVPVRAAWCSAEKLWARDRKREREREKEREREREGKVGGVKGEQEGDETRR